MGTAGIRGRGRRVYPGMELILSDDAAELLARKGGVCAIDYIPPIG